MSSEDQENQLSEEEKKSPFGVIVHSFFVIPFLLAVFSVLLFTSIRILTVDKKTAYDYLEDVHSGGLTKRWQSAFELSKILANDPDISRDQSFADNLKAAFDKSQHDDPRVRQYLALAMGRTGNAQFADVLRKNLHQEKDENIYSFIYSLGILKDKESVTDLLPFLDHTDSRLRLATIMSLGEIASTQSRQKLIALLDDPEPNVRWEAAVALAKIKDQTGKDILLSLLDRSFLDKYPNVDAKEQTHVILVAIKAIANLEMSEGKQILKKLSLSDKNMNVRRAAFDALKSMEHI